MKNLDKLKEEVIGVEFKPINWDLFLLYGVFYEKIKNEFPKCEFAQATPSFLPNKLQSNKPSVIFRQGKGVDEYGLILQFQENKFIINYFHKKEVKTKKTADLFKKFDQYFKIFKDCYQNITRKNLALECFLITKSFNFQQGLDWDKDKDWFSKFPLLSHLKNFNITNRINPYFSFDFVKDNEFTLNMNFNKNIDPLDKKETLWCNFNALNLISNDINLQELVVKMEETLDEVIDENCN